MIGLEEEGEEGLAGGDRIMTNCDSLMGSNPTSRMSYDSVPTQ